MPALFIFVCWNWVMCTDGWSLTANIVACDACIPAAQLTAESGKHSLFVGIAERKTKVRKRGRNKEAMIRLHLLPPPLPQRVRSDVLSLPCISRLPFEDWPPRRRHRSDRFVLASAVCKHTNKWLKEAGITERNNLWSRFKSHAFDFGGCINSKWFVCFY